jgi:hypothetical protein
VADVMVKRLVDDAMDAYVEWREECLGLVLAYRRWSDASSADSELAFAAYHAAVDREERAAAAYRDAIGRLVRANPRSVPILAARRPAARVAAIVRFVRS